MAGVKGRSGGARTRSGGARPGAGRKKKAPIEKSKESANATSASTEASVLVADMDMLQFLKSVARGTVKATSLQVRAAIAAVQYTHDKRHDGGKKEAAQATAHARTQPGGRFSPSSPPKLVVDGGKKVD